MEKKIVLPEKLDTVPRAAELPRHMHRWNTNEEVASILIAFNKHKEWESREVPVRPPSGSMFLYSRKKVRYRKDSYCWKKRKDGRTTREDHMKLKVQGIECIYGCYVHSAILPTFHRRCYWLLQVSWLVDRHACVVEVDGKTDVDRQNPDIVLVHYLNVPLTDDNKLGMPTLSCCSDNKEWTEDELVLQLRPMC
ncbi:hypothetical protein LSH36_181g04033 [Paralvinella palmiformis]|uniref:CG-1 domain-containing protein n=1 Tax=Paralvinella palmiformis TaxID=53620 RepID=A0AAD9N5W4_9ANNE|nr:hypothetical protein LSH36_181g04033 [Paralvinella palmiformis]